MQKEQKPIITISNRQRTFTKTCSMDKKRTKRNIIKKNIMKSMERKMKMQNILRIENVVFMN